MPAALFGDCLCDLGAQLLKLAGIATGNTGAELNLPFDSPVASSKSWSVYPEVSLLSFMNLLPMLSTYVLGNQLPQRNLVQRRSCNGLSGLEMRNMTELLP